MLFIFASFMLIVSEKKESNNLLKHCLRWICSLHPRPITITKMVASTWKICQQFWKCLDCAAVKQLLLSNYCQILKGSYSQKVEADLIRNRRLPITFHCLYLNATMSSNCISMKETHIHPLAVNSWHCPLPWLSKELSKATAIWRRNACKNLGWQLSPL